MAEMTFDAAWESLTQKQKRFVMARQEHATKKEAAEAVGVAPRTTYSWPKEVDWCADKLIDHQLDAVRADLRKIARESMNELSDLASKSDDDRVRLQAIKYAIDQAIGKAKQTAEVENKQIGSINVNVKGGD